MPIGSTQQAGGAAAIQPQKQNFLQSILGRFRGRSAAKVQPAASASVKQHSQPKASKDTSLQERRITPEKAAKPIVSLPSKARGVHFGATSSSGPDLPSRPHKFSLRNHEQQFLRETLGPTKPGVFRKLVYSLNLSFPSHPKKEIAEFKNYLQESATNLQQLDDVSTFVNKTGLADCQIRKILGQHKKSLAASTAGEAIVERLLAKSSNNGQELTAKLQKLTTNASRDLPSLLSSQELLESLALEAGLNPPVPKRVLFPALGFDSSRSLHTLVLPKLEEQLSQFHADPEAAQDIIDTYDPNAFQGPNLVQNNWDKINERSTGIKPIDNYNARENREGPLANQELKSDD